LFAHIVGCTAGGGYTVECLLGDPPEDYASCISGALRKELGNSHQSIKTLMRWTGANERTAKNWLSGTNGPSGEHLLEILRHSDPVFECVLERIDRAPLLSHRSLQEVHDVLQGTAQVLWGIIKAKNASQGPH
jgi:hypothetical protein